MISRSANSEPCSVVSSNPAWIAREEKSIVLGKILASGAGCRRRSRAPRALSLRRTSNRRPRLLDRSRRRDYAKTEAQWRRTRRSESTVTGSSTRRTDRGLQPPRARHDSVQDVELCGPTISSVSSMARARPRRGRDVSHDLCRSRTSDDDRDDDRSNLEAEGDQCVVLRDIGWKGYSTLLQLEANVRSRGWSISMGAFSSCLRRSRTNISRSGSGILVTELVGGPRHPLHRFRARRPSVAGPGGAASRGTRPTTSPTWLEFAARRRSTCESIRPRPRDRGRHHVTTRTRRSRSTADSGCPRSGSAIRIS